MEEIDYSVLYRWFVGLSMDDPIWSPTTFSKNRDRLLESDIAAAFFDGVLALARTAGLLSDEHFTVDGTLLEAWASLKSFRRTDEGPTPPPDDPGNPTVNFHGESRRNDTHQSTTDPDAQLARKGQGKEAKLSYAGHVLLDNRHADHGAGGQDPIRGGCRGSTERLPHQQEALAQNDYAPDQQALETILRRSPHDHDRHRARARVRRSPTDGGGIQR